MANLPALITGTQAPMPDDEGSFTLKICLSAAELRDLLSAVDLYSTVYQPEADYGLKTAVLQALAGAWNECTD